jgi:hypothetical protein
LHLASKSNKEEKEMEGGEIEGSHPFGSNPKKTKKQRGPFKHQ